MSECAKTLRRRRRRSRRTLKTVLKDTGSQCGASKTGVMFSLFLVFAKCLSAEFCISCSFPIDLSGRPVKRALQ